MMLPHWDILSADIEPQISRFFIFGTPQIICNVAKRFNLYALMSASKLSSELMELFECINETSRNISVRVKHDDVVTKFDGAKYFDALPLS